MESTSWHQKGRHDVKTYVMKLGASHLIPRGGGGVNSTKKIKTLACKEKKNP